MSSGSFDSDVWLRGLSYTESVRAQLRRKRLMRRLGYLSAVAVACLLAWTAVAVMCGY